MENAMRITVAFKTPDVMDYAVTDAVSGLPEEEADALRTKITFALGKFIAWGEVITVDFDLEAGTATVREAHQ
jgi:hypothetical protein